MEVGLPPRVVDKSLLPNLRQVDFVGYIPTPGYEKYKPFGVASKQVAAQRAKRRGPPKTAHGLGAACAGNVCFYSWTRNYTLVLYEFFFCLFSFCPYW